MRPCSPSISEKKEGSTMISVALKRMWSALSSWGRVVESNRCMLRCWVCAWAWKSASRVVVSSPTALEAKNFSTLSL